MGRGGMGCILLAQDSNQCMALVNMVIEIGWDSMDCIDEAQVSDQCRAPVNTAMNLRVQLNVRSC
jgi:hypothetical protein